MGRAQRLVCLVALTLFSCEWNGVFSSPGDASATLVQWYGTRGVVTQEEFVELGRGVQTGQVVTTSASPQTNDSCVSMCASFKKFHFVCLQGHCETDHDVSLSFN